MTIGIIVAMSKEYALIVSQLKDKQEHNTDFCEGTIGKNRIILAKSGIGKVCSAVGALELIKQFAPDVIINTGVAGGIDASLDVADIVAGTEMVYHDVWCGDGNEYGQVQGLPARYRADHRLLKAAQQVDRVKCGLICSGDQFITDRPALNAIKQRFQEALAVDMESASIAQVCHLYHVPFLSLRIISDTPGVDHHSEQYQHFWDNAPENNFKTLCQILNQL